MSKYLAKKGFIYFIKHKKWKPREFLEPILIVPLGLLVLLLFKNGLTPFNILYCLAGLAYLTVLFRFYKIK